MSEMQDRLLENMESLPLAHRHLFDTAIDVNEPLDLGRTPQGDRRIRIGNGGVFRGERLSGEILPHGTNWSVTRPDGVGEFDVRLTLRTDDGVFIYMQSNGYIRVAREMVGRFFRGEASPEDYYLRERTILETSAKEYAWLNSIVAVGVGWYKTGIVGMSIYEIC